MILCYSGTGNSRYIAQRIADELQDNIIDLNEKIKTNNYSSIETGGDVILVVPTYAWRIPKIVSNWLYKTKFIGAKRIWFVMNCGSEIGNATKYNLMLANDKHLDYMGTKQILMPENYIAMFNAPQLEEKMFLSIIEESGYEAIKSMAYAFYDYATENKGIFEAMLWYNKYMIEEGNQVTHNTFDILFKILRKQNLSDETINHFIRTLRVFLEGYVLLVNHQAFGHPLSIQKSFDFSLNILINGVKNMEGK